MAFETSLNVRIDPTGARVGARGVERALTGMGRRTAAVLGRMKMGFAGLRASLFSIKGLLVGGAAGLLGKSFLDAAVQTENLEVRLKSLTGSAGNAQLALKAITEFASGVAFSFEEIQASSGSLITISKDVEEFNKIMKITADIAAVTGLSFQDTSAQILRAFSGGIAAADMFRERGVNAMLGFQQGVQVSADETRKKIVGMWFGPGSATNTLKDAAQDLATTWTGITSMLGDRWFAFRRDVLDNGVFDLLKASAQVTLDFIDGRFGEFTKNGQNAAATLAEVFGNLFIGIADFSDKWLIPVFETFSQGVDNIMKVWNAMPSWMQNVGMLGAIMLGPKGVAAITFGAGLIDKLEDTIVGALKGLGANVQTEDPLKLLWDLIVGPPSGKSNLETGAGSIGKIGAAARGALGDVKELAEQMRAAREAARGKTGTGKFDRGGGDKADPEFLKDMTKAIEKSRKEMERFGRTITDKVMTPIEAYNTQVEKLKVALSGGFISQETFTRGVKDAAETMKDAQDKTNKYKDAALDLGDAVGTAFEDAIVSGKGLREVMRGLLEDIQRIILRAAVTKPLEKLVGGFFEGLDFGGTKTLSDLPGVITADSSAFASLSGRRASGGAVQAGQSFLVGERGPELFTPGSSGNITANGRGVGTTIIMDLRGSNGDASIQEAVTRGIRNAAPGLVNASVEAVRDNRARNPSFFGPGLG